MLRVDPPPLEQEQRLDEARLGSVLAALKASGAMRVLDVGCGEGKLLRDLLKDRQFDVHSKHGRLDPGAGTGR